MQAILVNFVAVTLLIQSSFGCCRGGLQQLFGKANSTAAVACCHSCCHHAQPDDEHQSEKSNLPVNGKSNCEGVCTFLVTAKAQIESPHLAFDLVAAPLDSSAVPQLGITSWALDGPNEASPRVRLHLLNRIWLI